MRTLPKATQFVNFDGRRVLDNRGLRGMDGTPGLGSDTEIRVGRVAEEIFKHAPFLDNRQLDDLLKWLAMYKT